MSVSGADLLQEVLHAHLDREAIVALGVRHANALDRCDWVTVRSCFADDAVAEYEGIGTLLGPEAIAGAAREKLEPLRASQHLVANFAVETAGDTATCTSYFHAQHVRPGTPGGDHLVVAGTYTDALRRVDGDWKIARRDLTVTWTEGNDAVLAP